MWCLNNRGFGRQADRRIKAQHRLVKRQTQYRLAQIERQIKALDVEIMFQVREARLSHRFPSMPWPFRHYDM